MSNSQRCPHCRRPMMANRHTFSASLARILLDIAELFGPGEPFHLQKDFPEWTHNQYANVQKLKYWNLIEKHRDFVGKRAGGFWHLTSGTLKLIGCCESISLWVRTFNNEVVERSQEMTTFKGAIGYYDIPEKWAARARPVEACDKGQLAFSY